MASSTTVPKPSRTITDTGTPSDRRPSLTQLPRWVGPSREDPLASGVLQHPPCLRFVGPELLLAPFGAHLLQRVQPAEAEPVLALGVGHHSQPPAELPGDDGVLHLPQHRLDPLGHLD